MAPTQTRKPLSLRPSLRFRIRRDQESALFPAARLWTLTALAGAGFGTVEGSARLVLRQFEHRLGDPDLWVNWQAPWLAAPSMALLFLGLGILLSLARLVLPTTVKRLTPFLVMALGTWSLLGLIPGLSIWSARLLTAGISWRLCRLAGSTAFAPCFRLKLALVVLWSVLFIVTGAWPAACGWRTRTFAPMPRPGAPNVLMIVLDTVRADNMSLHGYSRETTPQLAARAVQGIRFNQARATTPFTLGTHASLFTGRYMSETSARVNARLDSTHPTLAEYLRDGGYRTAAFVGNIFYASAHYGLDRGFQHYHDTPANITRRVTPRELVRASVLGQSLVTHFERKWRILAPMQRQRLDAAQLNREALAWLDHHGAPERPFFLFLNYFDAHAPYSLPPEAPTKYSTVTPVQLEKNLKHLQSLQERLDRDPRNQALAAEAEAASTAVFDQLRNAYDDGIAYIDTELDHLLNEFDRRGLLDNTLVLITSDHGEMLGEHGLIGHGQCLYRQVVHVPLVILGGSDLEIPANRVVDQPVSLRDVAATVLDLIGTREANFPGDSLATHWQTKKSPAPAPRPAFSEMQAMPWQPRTPRMPAAFGPQWLLTLGEYSYHRQDHDQHGTTERLFDLAQDPEEFSDLSRQTTHQPQLDSLRSLLRSEWQSSAAP